MNIHSRMSSGLGSVDLKDALEGYNSCQHAKSLFFWLILLFLLVQTAAFWVVDLGQTRLAIPPAAEGRGDMIRYEGSPATVGGLYSFVALNFVEVQAEQDGPTVESPAPSDAPKVVTPGPQEQAVPDAPALSDGGPMNDYVEPDEQALRKARTLRGMVEIGLMMSMYVLTFGVILYCLCLLAGLQIALVGRLGGVTENVRAFLIALVLAVIVVPWTRMICGWSPGVMFNLAELEDAYRAKIASAGDVAFLAKYYGRFIGFWLLALLLLIVAETRNSQAGKRIGERLERMEKAAETAEAEGQ